MPFLDGDDLPSIVRRIAEVTPDRIALLQDGRRVTWSGLAAAIERVATALLARSLDAGERVAILAANSIEYVEVFFGALRAGLCVVPLPTLASVDALDRMLDDCAAGVLFASREHRDVARSLIRTRAIGGVGLDFDDEDFAAYGRLVSQRRPLAPPSIRGDQWFDIIYSSGTTGVPKGIVHTHAARRASYAGSRSQYFSRESVNLVATPFYSNTTCVTWFLATAAGGANAIVGKFSPQALAAAAERYRGTHAMLVPVQYERLVEAGSLSSTAASSLKYLFSTSAPLRAETKREVLEGTGASLVEIYGLTEGGAVTVLDARRHPDKLPSVGRPGPGVEILVVDGAGRDVAPGQAGEVVGRSTNMMAGYLNRPDDTAAVVFRRDGKVFFRTGDIGRFDDDGFLYLLDRKEDVIISGGFNVYATDVERVLLQHPAVAEAAVIGIPSDRWGETPLGLVVLRSPAHATEAEVMAFCNERVGKLQRVSAVEVRADLPKNAIGKILKRDLKEPYWKGRA
jgi:acyl-CoA synthetase (AMP-forming)/AMP-acid ligase II